MLLVLAVGLLSQSCETPEEIKCDFNTYVEGKTWVLQNQAQNPDLPTKWTFESEDYVRVFYPAFADLIIKRELYLFDCGSFLMHDYRGTEAVTYVLYIEVLDPYTMTISRRPKGSADTTPWQLLEFKLDL